MIHSHHPSCYEINTRVWLTKISHELGRTATLDDIPDTELDRLAEFGFDWVWLLCVWQTGLASQHVSRTNPELRREFQEVLPDLHEEDIGGSSFAITAYKASENLGGDPALARLRERLRQRGMRLMLDFVPNHTGLDHPWVEEHPEFYVVGSEQVLTRAPENYARVRHKQRDIVLAYGRDPNFPGWPDTFQLNYGNPATQEAMIGELMKVARQCDGVRCDMAILVLPDVFQRTWGIPAQPFWPRAIQRVRKQFPTFCFLAEAYWDLEWTLQQQGFDYTYDKRLYDRLRDRHARPVREHFMAGLDYQNKLARFLENHDEPRAAVTFPPGVHEAAVISYLCPGMRFFHQGQFEGRKRHISPHLCRAPDETVNEALERFYTRLLAVMRQPVLRYGQWQLLQCVPAWEGNSTWDCILAFGWQGRDGQRLLVTVNLSDNQSQCYVRLPFSDLGDRAWRLRDLIGDANYDRDGKDLRARGLYLDLSPWKASIFELTQLDQA